MSTQINRKVIILAGMICSSIFAAPVFASPAAHLSAASTHSAAASAHAGAAVVKGAAAVAATPLIVVGASGIASAAAGSALHEYANEPLRIGHKVMHTHPKNKAATPSPTEQMADPKQGKKP